MTLGGSRWQDGTTIVTNASFTTSISGITATATVGNTSSADFGWYVANGNTDPSISVSRAKLTSAGVDVTGSYVIVYAGGYRILRTLRPLPITVTLSGTREENGTTVVTNASFTTSRAVITATATVGNTSSSAVGTYVANGASAPNIPVSGVKLTSFGFDCTDDYVVTYAGSYKITPHIVRTPITITLKGKKTADHMTTPFPGSYEFTTSEDDIVIMNIAGSGGMYSNLRLYATGKADVGVYQATTKAYARD